MNVLLSIAPYNFCELYPDRQAEHSRLLKRKFGLVPGATTPLGLLYIAGVLIRDGHNVIIADGVFFSWEEMTGIIKTERPDIIGISVTAFAWERTRRLISVIKKTDPKIYTIIGGPLPDALKEECLEEEKLLDAVSVGDGEYNMRDLCRTLDEKKSPSSVKGIIWKDEQGVIIKNPPRPFIRDLDELPYPARELVDLNKYSPAIGHYKKLPNATIIASRGCKGECIFCHTKIFPGLRTRFRDPLKVVEEMVDIKKKYGVKDFLFWDNNLTENRDWIMSLCEEIINMDLDIVWSGNTRADSIDEEIISVMKRSGCWKLLLGVESGSQKSLDILNKGENIEQIENAVAMIKKAGITVFATFIFGIPGETYEEALETIDFAIKLDPDVAKFFTLSCNPGTFLYSHAHEYGNLIPGSESQSFHSAGFVPHTMTREELQELLHTAYRRFYLRPHYIIRRALKVRSTEDLRQNIRGFLAFR